MLTRLRLAPPDAPLRLLALGAHADDIEIGAGGTLRRLLREYPGAVVRWAVFSATPARAAEARASAAAFLADAGSAEVAVYDFPDGHFPAHFAALKARFEAGLKPFAPHLVLTHARDDRHQDHRTLSDLSWNTFRHHAIWEYEIHKYDGDLGQPSLYVTLDEAEARWKADALYRAFPSQHGRHWFTPDTFLALMRLRGIEAAAPFAEAFHARKMVV